MQRGKFSALGGTAAVALIGCVLQVAGPAPVQGGEWFDLNERALANFDFEGQPLPSAPAELRRQFPQAVRDEQRVDEAIGLECYQVTGLESADVARFYFCDGRLYQLEIVYDLPRVKRLGGMRSVLESLVNQWGPADHAGESRWTWQRAMIARRADFYAWPDSAQLTITDMELMPVIAQRLKRAERQDRANLGL